MTWDLSKCAWVLRRIVKASWVALTAMWVALRYSVIGSLNTSGLLYLTISSWVPSVIHWKSFFAIVILFLLIWCHFHLWMCTMVELGNILNHRWPHGLVIIIKCTFSCRLPPDRYLSCFKLLLNHWSLCKICHRWALSFLQFSSLLISPIRACLFKLLNSLFKYIIIFFDNFQIISIGFLI